MKRWDGFKWRECPDEVEERKPFELWVNVYDDGDLFAHLTKEDAEDNFFEYCAGRIVHMLEACEVERRVRAEIERRTLGFMVKPIGDYLPRADILPIERWVSRGYERSQLARILSDDEGES